MRSVIPVFLLILTVRGAVVESNTIAIIEILPEIPVNDAPLGVSSGSSDSLWVIMTDEPLIRLMDGDGRLVRSFGGFGTGSCEFRDRIVLTDTPSLFIYAADTDNGRILKLNRSGVCVREIRKKRDGSLEMWRPSSVAASQSGRIYVADADAGTVHYIDTFDGLRAFIDPFERGTAIPVQPVLLACDGEILYIVDDSDGTIYSYDALGNLLGRKSTDFAIRSCAVTLHGYCAISDGKTDDIYFGRWNDSTWTSLRDLVPELSECVPGDICFSRSSTGPQRQRCLWIVDSLGKRIIRLSVRFL